MAVKTANVNVRVEQDVKDKAEAILAKLGVSASAFINMTYRQVILRKGIPFDVAIPAEIQTRDTMSDAEFDAMMATGLAQAKAGDSIPYEAAFDSLLKGL
ncbi:MAG: type II toxin-antitoxin system RelB/DinJ family antitoxin [Eubacteriales bacterium]|nr:type II toxin-antitoxin system RelB/DinJ family antitoxin [Eubacteriales bacterium]